jgi:MerR family transcriptional regulator, light-induced transcriptional regulator
MVFLAKRSKRFYRPKRDTTVRKTILSTADVARMFSVTETTVKRWADDGTLKCQKTPGGHRKFEIRNVVDFAEKNSFDPVGVLAYAGNRKMSESLQVAILERDYSVLVRVYVERALSPDTTDLFAFLSFLYEHRIQLADIYDRVLRPGMREIGEMWADGRIGIGHEHRASYETIDALAKLQTEILMKPSTGKNVLCACFGQEPHEIGLRCAANLFESEGWKVHYLGARTPVEAIVASMQEIRPDVVSLSITHVEPGGGSVDKLPAIARAAKELGARIVLGGVGALQALPGAGADGTVLTSCADLVEYIGAYAAGTTPAGMTQA